MKKMLCLALVASLVACATSPTGRKTLKLFSSQEMDKMGAAAYLETKKSTPVSKSSKDRGYVACVSNAMTSLVGGDWEVTVFDDETPNAFALPGGKIGVHSGLLDVAKTPDQLAAVIGHEIAHVQAEHSNERVSTNYVTQTGLALVDAVTGAAGVAYQQEIMALLGVGAQVGVLLPFSRAQETESDILGLGLMANAGFDPRHSVDLWRNMSAANGGKPAEFLSTHPSDETRIKDLQSAIPEAMPIYEQAKSSGRRPNCRR